MLENHLREASFIVRIYWEKYAGDSRKWRGQAIHVQTQKSIYFERIDELNKFFNEWTGIFSLDDGYPSD